MYKPYKWDTFRIEYCFCGKSFAGRDSKRLFEHLDKHSKYCTTAKRARREFKKKIK